MQTLLELGEKRRRQICSMLHHAVALDTRYSQHLSGIDTFPSQVETLLTQRGAPRTCYVIGSKLDGREVALGEALQTLISMGNGFYVSCIPGRLGFFEYSSMKSSYLLVR